ncbi:MAG: aminotransferase class V-fold PLP-dependent enzyme [Candidatus Micrarchaeota archaeon]|nr:aminotransferase class V-fold PLP-dependent enzyme [Candidatus Micrarchaeota archaeon]
MALDAEKIRADFPLLQTQKIVYFDSACTTLKPRAVIDAERKYYEEMSGCAGRSAHTLAKRTDEAFVGAREKIAKFVGAKADEVIFTKNTTEALNLVIRSFDYSQRKKIVTTQLEHHSALLPIMEQQRRGVAKMELLKTNSDGTFDESSIVSTIDRSTALVVVHHTTNTTGMRSPLERIIKIAHENGAAVLVDGAQGVPHSKVDFRKLGADFLAFSGHKMLGPTGIGCLVGKTEALEKLDTYIVGGETIETVKLNEVKWKKAPKRFEAGIQNYAGAIGLGAACDYLSKIGMQNVEEHEKKMGKKLIEAIQSISGSTIYGTSDSTKRSSLCSFNLNKVPHHQVALMCDSLSKIALRSGTFCAQPAMESLGAPNGAVRASLYLYNTEKEIETFRETLGKIAKLG